MSAHPGLKCAVRSDIKAGGGVECAAATCDKSSSHAGRWNSLNDPDLPTLGDALALAEVVAARGERPAILARMATELGYALIRLPDTTIAAGELPLHVCDLVTELGDVSDAVREGLADRKLEDTELAKIEAELDQLVDRAVQARALVRAMQDKPFVNLREVG